MEKLDGDELRFRMRDLEGWKLLGDAIHKDFTFRGFRAAIAFVDRIAEQASGMGHHPDLEIHFNRVVVSLSTHDAGGVTEKDVELAQKIEAVVEPGDH
jgi:4a-hydroxytetrahydrobiopterin dehydratase